jgi:hypothetical protein
MPTKPAAWSIQPVIEAQVTAESTANRQHPSFDCLSRRHQSQEWLMGLKCAVGPASYGHKCYLKLSASAYQHPGAQLIIAGPGPVVNQTLLTDK